MLLGLTRLLDVLRGDSRAEELALMEAHGVATPKPFSRADPPSDVILDYMAGYLGVAGAAAGRLTCRAWCTALGRTQTMAQLVHREATACGRAPPLGFAESLARNDGAHHAWRLARAALRRRKLVVGERWAAQSVRSMRAVRNVATGSFTDRDRWAGTQFLLLNESDVPIYCHWINFDGEIEVRPGDRVEPRQQPLTRGGYLFEGIRDASPPGVFYHTSVVSHSFAICLEAGGPPIACYQQRRSYLPFSFGRTWVIQHVHGVAVRRGADGQLEVHELACVDRKLLQSAPADAQTRVSFDHLYVAPTAEPMRRIRVQPLHVRVPPRDADDFAWSTEIETDLTPALLADRLAGIDLPADRRDWRSGQNPWEAFQDLRPTQHGCPISYSYVDAGLVGQMLWENIWRQYDAGNSPPAGPRYAFEAQ